MASKTCSSNESDMNLYPQFDPPDFEVVDIDPCITSSPNVVHKGYDYDDLCDIDKIVDSY